MKFTEFDIHEDLLDSISYMGFEDATPVQEQAIPKILEGKDLIACAQTGTGKTAAFVLPVLNKISEGNYTGTSTLIIVPTRELAIQIDQHIQGIGYTLGINSIAVYGGGDGQDFGLEKKALTSGADIIVATPGKLISHLNMGYVKFDQIKHLILDEADRMLDIGFLDDIIKIISYIPEKRQTLMFSATMAPKIKMLASKILSNPSEITLAVSKPAEGVLQAAYLVYDSQKPALVDHLVADRPDYESILIFCSTKKKVSEIARLLKRTEKSTSSISSDLDQKERGEVMLSFKAKKTRILVATDVLSRGIDIKDINLIINYDVPSDAEDYVHRIGRTARADATGVAITFINPDDMFYFSKIEALIEKEVYKIRLPSDIGEGPGWELKKSGMGKRKFGKKNQGGKRRKY
ncbi:MAG: DEAD/DEAH box helicase [Bacteroidales bacterium]|nr:DEAD/DEAH box helicase [Bacteroidales bacterium]